MSLSVIDQKQAAMAIMGSLMAYNFYGRIEDAANIQAMQQEIIQLKSEQRDLWGKYNDNEKEKGAMMMNMADYMIEQEKVHSELRQETSRVELELTKLNQVNHGQN